MHRRSIVALCAAILSVALCSSAIASAASAPAVSVRIEGKTHTRLAASLVQTHTGSITEGGTPVGVCPATSAAGALQTATHHRWSGKFSTSLGDLLITTILGEAYTLSSTSYWGIWVNDRYATTGACGIKLHGGDRVLFAVDSARRHEHPIELSGSRTAHRGRAFAVKVTWFSDAGVAKPLGGARVRGAGLSAVTDRLGVARIVDQRAGTLVLQADRNGYIRAAALRVRVTG